MLCGYDFSDVLFLRLRGYVFTSKRFQKISTRFLKIPSIFLKIPSVFLKIASGFFEDAETREKFSLDMKELFQGMTRGKGDEKPFCQRRRNVFSKTEKRFVRDGEPFCEKENTGICRRTAK